ncbi:VOC family protein [Ketogulonicigenium vulgare]|uniref:VOC family protein n=1 Tax=Ketogulonicigenium vulgare TaxID=92945 RepID=UPI00235850AF|nr:VOC family protein [Ketogulonicigenium vulgare]
MGYQGTPCWYELGTEDIRAAGQFYRKIFGWQMIDGGMEEMDYHLGKSGEEMVAGFMSTADQEDPPPPNWLIYFAADDCDKTAADIKAAGGQIYRGPDDIPGTGRYAIAADPQGAVFGILQADMSEMSVDDIAKVDAGDGAFNQNKAGHGNWNELMTTDPVAAFDFYAGLFPWSKSQAMDMGDMGKYQLFSHKGADIGAFQGLGNAPVPAWLPYFGVDGSVGAVVQTIQEAGGLVHHGPSEVPGPAYIAIAQDPQGAWFAIVGPDK